MNDIFHLPTSTGSDDVQIFTNPSTVTFLQKYTWHKPRGKSMLYILCIGGGGGGGGGFTRAAGAAGGGGGSGGSSGVCRVNIPLHLLPDTLYIQVGAGGQGVGSGGGTAGSGVLSYVTISPMGTAAVVTNTVAISGAVGATGGGTGTGAAVGAAGAASTIGVIGSMTIGGLGNVAFIAGLAGVAGGAVAGAVGGAGAIGSSSAPFWQATGGAGTTSADFAGGLFTAVTDSWFSEQRPATPAAGATGFGSGGRTIWSPFFSFGGGGGSSSNASTGCAGGNGGYGAGGGGGGAGTTGGRGGDGGSGVVVMIAY